MVQLCVTFVLNLCSNTLSVLPPLQTQAQNSAKKAINKLKVRTYKVPKVL